MQTRATTTVVIAAGAVLAAVIVTRTPAQVEHGNGSCCLPNGGCIEQTGQGACDTAGGTFIPSSTCLVANCQSPPTVVGVSADVVIIGGGSEYKVEGAGEQDQLAGVGA